MMTTVEPPIDKLLPLSPAVFHILLSLTDGERHGYGIKQEIALRTDGQIKMGPGTLYGAIKRLLKQRLIQESDERPDPDMNDDERRRYYRLTDFGRRVTQAEAERLARLVSQAQAKQLLPNTVLGEA
jgi:DNA-binding PadR family transcriptional regulator